MQSEPRVAKMREDAIKGPGNSTEGLVMTLTTSTAPDVFNGYFWILCSYYWNVVFLLGNDGSPAESVSEPWFKCQHNSSFANRNHS
jgi:hypothetical protein